MTTAAHAHTPDAAGYFGTWGGRYVPETLVPALQELEDAFMRLRDDAAFQAELDRLLRHYAGRPTPIYDARRLHEALGGARIWLKREDLAHTGAHKINNALGQALLAVRSGKRRVIAETGAGQHGVATATVCAMFGLDCVVYMGEEDVHRQALNVVRMRMLGAEVVPVTSGSQTLKDAINEALRDWVTHVESTFYLFGSATGPHPYPLIVREFQKVIGIEARAQMLEQTGRLPDTVVACVNGGSNAIGIFHPFVDDPVGLVGVEAGGAGPAETAATLGSRQPRNPARGDQLPAAGRRRPGGSHAQHCRRLGLSGRRARARLSARYGSRNLRFHHRRSGPGRAADPGATRGDHSRPGIGARRGPCHRAGADAAGRRLDPGESLGARRQRHGHRRRCAGSRRLSRIDTAFRDAKADGRLVIAPYVALGYPDMATSVELARAYIDAGANLLELGVPFSDPIADGPTIQRATQRALHEGATLTGCIEAAAEIRAATGVPLVLMGYANPFLQWGYEDLARDLHDAGVDGLIVPDLLPDDNEELAQACSGTIWT